MPKQRIITICHGCGHMMQGKHYSCVECGLAHVRQQDVGWLYEDGGATFHPDPEEAA